MEQIGKYRVERLLGRGGFATVWLCHDPDLDRSVAVKILADLYALDPDVRRRFIQEARILSRLDDDRILRVHTIDTLDDGRPYFVADYADRGTLRDRIREWSDSSGPMQAQQAVGIVDRIAECLSVAHHHRVVHRDLKPTNVLYRSLPGHRREEIDETIVLADFGIARALEGATRAEVMTTAAGTVPYMAPEQAQGFADTRCDLYAASVIFYELLTGKPPFEGETDLAVLLRKQRMDFRRISEYRPGLPIEYDAFIDRGLASDREDRFSDTEEFLAQLRALPIPDVEHPPPRKEVPPLESQSEAPGSAPPTTPRQVEISDGAYGSDGAASPSDGYNAASAPGVREDDSGISVPEHSDPGGPATPPSEADSDPPDASLPSDRWRRISSLLRAIPVATAVGGILVIAVLIFAFTREDAPDFEAIEASTAAPTTETAPPSTTSPPPTLTNLLLPGHDDILEAVSYPDAEVCAPVPINASGADFSVECEVDEPGISATYSSWSSLDVLDTNTQRHLDEADGSGPRWTASGVRLGRRVTYTDDDGVAYLYWTYDTDTSRLLSGEVRHADGDTDALTTWWSDTGRVLADPPEPSPVETRLLDKLTFVEPSACGAERRDRPDLAEAQLVCRVEDDGLVISVTAISWEFISDLQQHWTDLEEMNEQTRAPWPEEEIKAGDFLTYTNPNGSPVLAWSNDSELLFVRATTGGNAEELRDWWLEVRN